MSDNCPAFVTYFGQDHICLHQRNKDEMIVSMVCNTNQGYAKGKRCRGQVGYVRSRAIDLSCRQYHILSKTLMNSVQLLQCRVWGRQHSDRCWQSKVAVWRCWPGAEVWWWLSCDWNLQQLHWTELQGDQRASAIKELKVSCLYIW